MEIEDKRRVDEEKEKFARGERSVDDMYRWSMDKEDRALLPQRAPEDETYEYIRGVTRGWHEGHSGIDPGSEKLLFRAELDWRLCRRQWFLNISEKDKQDYIEGFCDGWRVRCIVEKAYDEKRARERAAAEERRRFARWYDDDEEDE